MQGSGSCLIELGDQRLTHAWFPEFTDVLRNIALGLYTIGHALEKIAYTVGHTHQITDVHVLFPLCLLIH